MGDRTFFQMTIYKVDPDKLEAFMSKIEYELSMGTTPTLGEEFEIQEISVGTIQGLAPTLVELDPGAIWVMSEDPKYEYLGEIAMYHPEPGLFLGDCDSAGLVVLNFEQILETDIFTSPESDSYTLQGHLDAQDALYRLLGRHQIDAISAFIEATRDP